MRKSLLALTSRIPRIPPLCPSSVATPPLWATDVFNPGSQGTSLARLSVSPFAPLWSFINRAARMIHSECKSEHVTLLPQTLRWLPFPLLKWHPRLLSHCTPQTLRPHLPPPHTHDVPVCQAVLLLCSLLRQHQAFALAVLPSLMRLIASSPPLCSNVIFSVNPTLMTPFSLATPPHYSTLLYLFPLALTPIQHVIYLFVTFPFWCLSPSVRHNLHKDQDPYLFGSLMCLKQCLDKVGTH